MVTALTRVFVQRANEVAEFYADRVAAAGNPEIPGPVLPEIQAINKDSLKLHYHYPSPPGGSFCLGPKTKKLLELLFLTFSICLNSSLKVKKIFLCGNRTGFLLLAKQALYQLSDIDKHVLENYLFNLRIFVTPTLPNFKNQAADPGPVLAQVFIFSLLPTFLQPLMSGQIQLKSWSVPLLSALASFTVRANFQYNLLYSGTGAT